MTTKTKKQFQILDQDFEPIQSLMTEEQLKAKIAELRNGKSKNFYVVDHEKKTAVSWSRRQNNYFEEPADYVLVTAEKPLATSGDSKDAAAAADAIDATATDAENKPVPEAKAGK